jgi:hypothetical protein
MEIVALAASAAVIIQFIKTKILVAIWDKLGGAVKFGISVLVCAGVVVYKAIALSVSFNLNLIWILVEVVIAVTGAYKLASAFWPGLKAPVSK